jgi:hypothetical protein
MLGAHATGNFSFLHIKKINNNYFKRYMKNLIDFMIIFQLKTKEVEAKSAKKKVTGWVSSLRARALNFVKKLF